MNMEIKNKKIQMLKLMKIKVQLEVKVSVRTLYQQILVFKEKN